MTRLLFALSIVLLLSASAYAQSGRAKGATGKWPTPPVPTASPSPDPGTKSSKAALPKIVDGGRIYTSKEVDQKAQILKKPLPSFPREARGHMRRGYVILRVILAADETVKHIEVITGLPNGLTESAIAAAGQIKFKPAMKDGKPVSAWVEVQYHFQVL